MNIKAVKFAIDNKKKELEKAEKAVAEKKDEGKETPESENKDGEVGQGKLL